MRDQERQALVKEAVAGLRPNHAGRVRAKCPFCLVRTGKADRRGSLSASLTTGWYDCFKCGIRGRVDDYNAGLDDDVAPAAAVLVPPPESFMLLAEEPAASAAVTAPARAYLRGRGIGDDLWAVAGIGACTDGFYAGRVVVPITDVAGAWHGYVARTWAKKAPSPYRYPPGMRRGELLYNPGALLVETDVPLLVVEGVFDALHLWPDGVALLGKWSHAQVLMLARAPRPVVVVLDGDAVDECEELAYLLRLEGQQAGFVRLPPRMDPDDLPAAELRALAVAALDDDTTG